MIKSLGSAQYLSSKIMVKHPSAIASGITGL